MKRIFTILILLGSFTAAFAQGTGKISGVVTDGSNNQPVEFATIALIDPSSGKTVDGTVCDDKGKFTLPKVAAGIYKLQISFIGFETQFIDVEINDKGNNVDLGTIQINSTAQVLQEVTVQGQKSIIEERVDRTIYNAENDATAKGGDASDVLRRVPLLSVDIDGNVSLRGSSNITVLINNKPSTIMAGSIADALKQIPADEIKSVEVITSPSAKYDAEGSGGIINIITKKNTLQGATLNVDAGVGYRGSNLGLNGSYRRGKMGFNLGGFGRANYNVTGDFNNTQRSYGFNENSGERELLLTNVQSASTRNNNLFGRYQLGWDYEINKKNFLAASVRYGIRNGNSAQDNLRTVRTVHLDNSITQTLADFESTDNSGTVDLDFSYTRTFEKPQRELSFLALYSRNNRNSDFENISFNPDDKSEVLNRVKNENINYNEEFTIQFDYQTPIGTTQMVEFGAKEIIRKVSSDFQSFRADGADGEYEAVVNASSSNVLNYNQTVAAGYLAYTLNLTNGYAIKAGTRYEYTTITADFDTPSDEFSTDVPSYGVIVPSFNASRKLKNGNTVKIAYNRRIQRPSIRFLNPNVQANNPLNITIGDPALDPEYTNNYEMSYSTSIKGTSLNFSGFFRNSTGAIQSVREIKGDTIVTRFQNIGQEDAYGLSLFANVNIGGKLSLNGGGDVYYAVLDNNVSNPIYSASNEGWVANYRLFGNYTMKKGWGFQFFGFYRAPQVQLQGIQGGFGIYSLALRKEFNDKKGSVGFGLENFFTPSFKIKTETSSPVLEQNNINTRDILSFRVNFSYRFGKMSFDNQPRRRKRSINNDDMKDGGGDDGGGMGDGGMPRGNTGGGAMPAFRPATTATQPAKELKQSTDSVIYEAAGVWTYSMETPQGQSVSTLTIKKENGAYSGTIKSGMMRQEMQLTSVIVEGNNVTCNYTVNFGGNEVPIQIKGVISGDTMEGIMSMGQFRSFNITATRQVQ